MWTTPRPLKSPYSALKGPLMMLTSCDQLGRQALQRAEVALPVPLRRLVLLDVVDQHLEPAVDAAVVEVEAEAADLERLAAALVLARR